MTNPFKYGTIVEDEFFTDRREECRQIQMMLNSENHLVLISPRRYGKSSLVTKCIKQSGRPYISLNLQSIVSIEDFAVHLLKKIFDVYKWEKIKHLLKSFRLVPTISTNPMTDTFEVAFNMSADYRAALEDTLQLLQKVTTPTERLIVVFDEFQEIESIDKHLPKMLRSILQEQSGLNYIFLGSQESMMEEIFEKKKSPFYHFGQLMRLSKIPYQDFYDYIVERLSQTNCLDAGIVAERILSFTQCHPYYTQQLSAKVWDLLAYSETSDAFADAIVTLVQMHDLDYERLWLNMNRTDRLVLRELASGKGEQISSIKNVPQTTMYSALRRLQKSGYVIKTESYMVEDPFFCQWIKNNM